MFIFDWVYMLGSFRDHCVLAIFIESNILVCMSLP